MVEVELKQIDFQGRFTLPRKWREKSMRGTREVYILMYPEYLKIIPRRKVDLTKYFDSVEVDAEVENLSDYHEVRKCLRRM